VTNPTYPGAPGPRPATVSISTYLLWVTAAISLIGGIVSLTTVGALSDAYSELYAGTAAEGTESIVVGASVFGVVLNILFAAGLVILAIFNNRGRNGARITTWVLGGLMLCCGSFGLLGTAFTDQLSGLDSTGGASAGPTTAEVEAAMNNALPSWFEPVSTATSVLSLLTILGAVILLALPASNAFFRRPARGFDPSVPYPSYPGGQPPYPGGQPPYPGGQQPPYPQHPTSGAPPQGQPPQYPNYPTYPTGQPPAQQYPPAQQPQYPPAQPPAQSPPPPAQPPHPPSSDPWSRPDNEQRPPSDPTSQP
jgi:hypothetical protein